MIRKLLLTCIAVSAAWALADGDGSDPQARWQQFHQEFAAACGADLQSLCSTEEGRAKFKCLRAPANETNLSEACSDFLKSHPRKFSRHQD